MTINEVINKYTYYLKSKKNTKPDKTILGNFGNDVKEDDTVGKYSQTSDYAVFWVQTYYF